MFTKNETVPVHIQIRREWVFLLLVGIFLGSLTMLNILGITRFINLSQYLGFSPDSEWQIIVAVGVLPYPITFLCTDFISEIYGKRRANQVVWVGLILNCFVLFILWLGGSIDAPSNLQADGSLPLLIENDTVTVPHGYTFYEVRKAAFGATFASMLAYITAQFCDVHIFHFFKKLTKGKHLWLRNNASTFASQLVDSISVILITHYYANALPIDVSKSLFFQLSIFILSSYLFKVFFAFVDTLPFYFGTKWLRNYLHVVDEVE
jgi:queuosine precursor transporter